MIFLIIQLYCLFLVYKIQFAIIEDKENQQFIYFFVFFFIQKMT